MQMQNFQYGDYNYQYYLLREERKTLRLTVYPNLKIVLYVPTGHPEEKVINFLKRKCSWITAQVNDLKRLQKIDEEKEYVSGESFLYLGRQYKLIVKSGKQDSVHFENGKIIMERKGSIHDSAKNKTLIESWYEKRAEHVFFERYKQMLKKFDYDFVPELALRKMPKRWGSYLTKKKVLLNPELVKASKECIDYVITHELCHMKYHNHSKEYYRFLTSKCPNWKNIKEQLELRFTEQ